MATLAQMQAAGINPFGGAGVGLLQGGISMNSAGIAPPPVTSLPGRDIASLIAQQGSLAPTMGDMSGGGSAFGSGVPFNVNLNPNNIAGSTPPGPVMPAIGGIPVAPPQQFPTPITISQLPPPVGFTPPPAAPQLQGGISTNAIAPTAAPTAIANAVANASVGPTLLNVTVPGAPAPPPPSSAQKLNAVMSAFNGMTALGGNNPMGPPPVPGISLPPNQLSPIPNLAPNRMMPLQSIAPPPPGMGPSMGAAPNMLPLMGAINQNQQGQIAPPPGGMGAAGSGGGNNAPALAPNMPPAMNRMMSGGGAPPGMMGAQPGPVAQAGIPGAYPAMSSTGGQIPGRNPPAPVRANGARPAGASGMVPPPPPEAAMGMTQAGAPQQAGGEPGQAGQEAAPAAEPEDVFYERKAGNEWQKAGSRFEALGKRGEKERKALHDDIEKAKNKALDDTVPRVIRSITAANDEDAAYITQKKALQALDEQLRNPNTRMHVANKTALDSLDPTERDIFDRYRTSLLAPPPQQPRPTIGSYLRNRNPYFAPLIQAQAALNRSDKDASLAEEGRAIETTLRERANEIFTDMPMYAQQLRMQLTEQGRRAEAARKEMDTAMKARDAAVNKAEYRELAKFNAGVKVHSEERKDVKAAEGAATDQQKDVRAGERIAVADKQAAAAKSKADTYAGNRADRNDPNSYQNKVKAQHEAAMQKLREGRQTEVHAAHQETARHNATEEFLRAEKDGTVTPQMAIRADIENGMLPGHRTEAQYSQALSLLKRGDPKAESVLHKAGYDVQRLKDINTLYGKK